MAGEKYIDKAVARLLAYYESNFQTYLTAVETAQSLATGAMTAPKDYVPALLPEDTRSPLLQVFATGAKPEDGRCGLYWVDCTVYLGYVGDANVEAGQQKMRRYMTAMVDTLRADYTLGSTVQEAVDGEQSLDAFKPGDAQTRYAIVLDVEVLIYES